MDRWHGRLAVVTGAGGGIGSAIVGQLMKNKIIVVGLDVKQEALDNLSNEMRSIKESKLFGFACNLNKEEDIVNAFQWIKETIGHVSILINNAGIGTKLSLLELTADVANRIFKTNVTAPILCSREAVRSMLENNVTDGHIININSVCGHFVPTVPIPTVIYSASKHALCVFSEGLQKELGKLNTNIKVTNLSPGWVNTALIKNVETEDGKLLPEDIAAGCIEALKMNSNTSISQLTIMPIDEY